MIMTVKNPGWNRGHHPASRAAVRSVGIHGLDATLMVQRELADLRADVDRLARDPWQDLLPWEVTHNVGAGLKTLFMTPYYSQGPTLGNLDGVAVPTRLWYPDALHSGDSDRVEQAARTIPFLLRQAREHYAAAGLSSISDLSRPVLHFYGAEALAGAVATSLFGVWPGRDRRDRQHGLSADYAHPEMIILQPRGLFTRFYRAVRSDTLYNCHAGFLGRSSDHPRLLPRVHVDRCLAALGYTESLFARGVVPLAPSQDQKTPDLDVLVLPDAVLEYLVLYYCSIMARYHQVDWQTILQGDSERTLPIRRALAVAPGAFVGHLAQFLPTSRALVYFNQVVRTGPEWTSSWDLSCWKEPEQSELLVDIPPHPSSYGFLNEWQPSGPP